MINPNELRRGNLFADLDGKIHQVKGIDETCIVIEYFRAVSSDFTPGGKGDFNKVWPTKSISFEDAQPIPITPDILEKMGFEYGETVAKCNSGDKNNNAWSKQISNLDWLEFQMVQGVQAPEMTPAEWPEWRIVNECSWIRQDFWNQPKSVHQLQNLFYFLSGEELKLTTNDPRDRT